MSDAPWVLLHYLREGRRRLPRDREALLAWQDARVRRHLSWVRARSPYYRDLFADLDPREWRAWPTTDKAAMMANFDAFNTAGVTLARALAVATRAETERNFAPTIGPLTVGLSSGTSGARGVFLVSSDERRRWAAVILRRLLPGGLARPHRVAFFLRADSNLYRTVRSRRLQFTFFDLLAPFESHHERLAKLRPTVLVAPPGALRLIAEHGPPLAPERVVSVAEVLEPQDRAAIEARLGPVREVYQATEGFLGVSCAHGRLHLNEDLLAVDLEEAGEGRFTPVVTDFSRRTQPIVRYRLDDLLVPAPACACGSPLLALERVEGRRDDVLLLPARDGGVRRVFPDFVRRALMLAPGVREYRARQTAPDTLEVEVVPDTADVRGSAALALSRAWADLGVEDVHVHFVPYAFTPGARKLRRVERTWRPE